MLLMSIHVEMPEIKQILDRLLNNLGSLARVGLPGAELRQQLGIVHADYPILLRDKKFGAELLKCFTKVMEAEIPLRYLINIHKKLFEEKPVGYYATLIVQAAIIFCLSTESRMIVKMEFLSRDDVETLMADMKTAFDAARLLASDTVDTASYQTLTLLAGALTNHMAKTARPLPRMIKFNLPLPLPAMALSNRIYYDPTRWEEIIAENKTIHPLFCQRTIIGLSQ